MPEQAVWSGARPRPARLVDVVMFAWELDILEIRLHELEEVVDVFVIIESAFSQRGLIQVLQIQTGTRLWISSVKVERPRTPLRYAAC